VVTLIAAALTDGGATQRQTSAAAAAFWRRCRSEGALGFLGKNDRSRKFGEGIFEGDIIFFAREFLPAILRQGILGDTFLCKRNPSHNLGKKFLKGILFFRKRIPSCNFAGRNFGGQFFCKRNPSHNFAGRDFGWHFLGDRNPSRKVAGRNFG
jgi:hypothetical protein